MISPSPILYQHLFPNNSSENRDNSDDDIINPHALQPPTINPNFSENSKKIAIKDDLGKLLINKGKCYIKSEITNDIKVSKRNENIIPKLCRNLIQIIFLIWINFDCKNVLKKIDPKLFNDKYKNIKDFINKTLREIYSNDICKKEIKENINIEHNIKLIQNLEKDCLMGQKLCLTFREALKLFFKDSIENISLNSFPNFLSGLEDYHSYFESSLEKYKNKYKYHEKVAKILLKFYELTVDGGTTGLTLEENINNDYSFDDIYNRYEVL